ncbi:hypothetical protein HNY73_011567, partial [Argiope bruennichi]
MATQTQLLPNTLYTTLDQNNRYTYPVNGDGDQYYLQVNGEDVPLDNQYAKDKWKNEKYPKDALKNDKPLDSTYAVTANGTPIFPKTNNGDEFYVEDSEGSSVIMANKKPLPRYAKTKLTEIYPIKLNFFKQPREVIINDKYAKLSNNDEFYPLDECGNEYTLDIKGTLNIDEKKIFPNGYPITNDNFIIVPNIQRKPYFIKNSLIDVKDGNILGKLFRDETDYMDYLTNIASKRASRSDAKEYKFLQRGMWKPIAWVPHVLRHLKIFDSSTIMQDLLYSIRWERLPDFTKSFNTISIQITFLNDKGIERKKIFEYNEWFGVCTSKIDHFIEIFQSHFPNHSIRYELLGPTRKVLPYFRKRLQTGKLDYKEKSFYKIYTSACHEDVGRFFNKYKVAYYDQSEWLVRIYIDLCTRYKTRSFYYAWYTVGKETNLMDALCMHPDCYDSPNWTIGAFDLETVPMDGAQDRIPTGLDASDKIVMASVYRWNKRKGVQNYILYLLPPGTQDAVDSFPNSYAYKSKKLKKNFYSLGQFQCPG